MNHQINLFCFAHAGGTSMMYSLLKKKLEGSINVIQVERPGRGVRFNESLIDNMEDLLDDALNVISPYLNDGKYALMGHSMGGLIAFELAQKLSFIHNRKPDHVFISSRNVPHVIRSEMIHNLPEEEFIRRIYNIGGTHQEIFSNEELRSIYLPILRSDFKALERFEPKKDRNRINSGVSLLRGKQESFKNSEFIEWGSYFNGDCKLYEFEGDHFYILSKLNEVSVIISKTLLK